MTDHPTRESLRSPINTLVIRFCDDESDRIGTDLILTGRVRGQSLGKGIFGVWEQDLYLLDGAELKYNKYQPKTSLVREVYEHFGLAYEPPKHAVRLT